MKVWLSRIILLTLGFTSLFGYSQEDTDSGKATATELAIQDKARKKLYPGGRDEEDLKINLSSAAVYRKLNKSDIEKEVYKQLFNEDLKPAANSEVDAESDSETE